METTFSYKPQRNPQILDEVPLKSTPKNSS